MYTIKRFTRARYRRKSPATVRNEVGALVRSSYFYEDFYSCVKCKCETFVQQLIIAPTVSIWCHGYENNIILYFRKLV